MTTQSADRNFRPESQEPVFPARETPESGQKGTDRTEIPVEIPVTERKRESYFIPPNFLTQPRPAWTEVRDYAKQAPYLGGGNAIVRGAGQAYSYIAIAMALLARNFEWIHERPARAAFFWLMIYIALRIFF